MAGHTASARAERQWTARATTGALAVAYYHFHECDRKRCEGGGWELLPIAAKESQDSTNARTHVPYPSASKDQAAPPARQPPRERGPPPTRTPRTLVAQSTPKRGRPLNVLTDEAAQAQNAKAARKAESAAALAAKLTARQELEQLQSDTSAAGCSPLDDQQRLGGSGQFADPAAVHAGAHLCFPSQTRYLVKAVEQHGRACDGALKMESAYNTVVGLEGHYHYRCSSCDGVRWNAAPCANVLYASALVTTPVQHRPAAMFMRALTLTPPFGRAINGDVDAVVPRVGR
jgi:hypothetical protein